MLDRRRFLAGSLAAMSLPLVARAAERREVPWLQAVQTPPGRLPPDAPRLEPVLVDAAGRPIESLQGWLRRREELRQSWLEFLQPLALRPQPPQLEVLEEDHPDGCVRQLVRYESEPGLPVEAYLLKPKQAAAKSPGVVALHSTVNFTIRQPAGLEGDPEDFFGLELARRGVVAICPRCFLWEGAGNYAERVARFQARHPGSKGMAKMLWDAQRAVDVLCGLPEVDPERLGAVGHSLGAKEVLYLTAFDPRIKVAVASEGGVGVKFSNWDAPWYLGAEAADKDFPRDHHELLALAAPRAFLVLGGDSADGDRTWPYIEAALPVYRLYGGPARLGLFNHQQGHSVPPEAQRRLYEWFAAYL